LFKRFALIASSFFYDCEPEILAGLHSTGQELSSLGLSSSVVNVDWWADSFEIFAPIQAWEAARIHVGHFDQFERSIRERLEWGAGISPNEILALRQRHSAFRQRMDELLSKYDLLLLPAAPVTSLIAGADHSQTRVRLLRYTTPFSLAGVPVITIPCSSGGMQLASARGNDEALAQLAAGLGAHRKVASQVSRP
jgi:aspartyl-tRNA(Asn)/glutamyl-tRNA(Gln) amidotransferase subunit A